MIIFINTTQRYDPGCSCVTRALKSIFSLIIRYWWIEVYL